MKTSTGWTTCAGNGNQIPGKPCAICGHMTHERDGRSPEQRIAADLGLTTDDLERIVRDERARRLGPRMVEHLRRIAWHIDRMNHWRGPSASQTSNDIAALLAEIDRPINT